MVNQKTVERLEVAVKTPAGLLTTPVEVPTGFVPVTAIVPLMRRIGEQAEALEERKSIAAGEAISCKKGCAACCRMLVPVMNVAAAGSRLERAGLLARLTEIAETSRQLSDEEMEPLNRDYYALRMPCPFLENEVCSIYEDRPAACRELLVTSPAELCQDMVNNPVRPLPVPVRMSTVLGLLWSELSGGPARLIPLPVALDWAERNAPEGARTWKGASLFESALDKVWRSLNQAMGDRSGK